jgi:hypothetical protein
MGDVTCDIRLTLKPGSAFAAEVLLDDLDRLRCCHPPLPPRSLAHLFSPACEPELAPRHCDALAALRGTTFKVKRSSGAVDA